MSITNSDKNVRGNRSNFIITECYDVKKQE